MELGILHFHKTLMESVNYVTVVWRGVISGDVGVKQLYSHDSSHQPQKKKEVYWTSAIFKKEARGKEDYIFSLFRSDSFSF